MIFANAQAVIHIDLANQQTVVHLLYIRTIIHIRTMI